MKHYLKRWPKETFFRETKRWLGFDKYQIHTRKGMKRCMYLVMLTYINCALEVQSETLGFSKGPMKARNEVKKLEVTWIYNQVIQGIQLQDILKRINIAYG